MGLTSSSHASACSPERDRKRALATQAAEKLQPVHALHHHVEDGRIESAGQGQSESLFGIGRALANEALAGQVVGHHARKGDVVVDEQDTHKAPSLACRRPA